MSQAAENTSNTIGSSSKNPMLVGLDRPHGEKERLFVAQRVLAPFPFGKTLASRKSLRLAPPARIKTPHGGCKVF